MRWWLSAGHVVVREEEVVVLLYLSWQVQQKWIWSWDDGSMGSSSMDGDMFVKNTNERKHWCIITNVKTISGLVDWYQCYLCKCNEIAI